MSALANISNKYMNRLFRKVDGLVWDLTSGATGIKKNDGIYTLSTITAPVAAAPAAGDVAAVAAVEGEYQVNINPFDSFSVSIPAFAVQVPLEKVNPGDLIIGADGPAGWVTKVRDRSLALMDANGLNKSYTPQKTAVLGADGVLVVQNLLSLGGGEAGLAGLQNNILPLLALADNGLGGGDGALDKILPLILFSQTQGGAGATGIASQLPMLMMLMGGSGGNSKIDKLLPLLMMGGLGGAGAGGAAGGLSGILPLLLLSGDDSGGGLFGGSGSTSLGNASNSAIPSRSVNLNPPLTRTR